MPRGILKRSGFIPSLGMHDPALCQVLRKLGNTPSFYIFVTGIQSRKTEECLQQAVEICNNMHIAIEKLPARQKAGVKQGTSLESLYSFKRHKSYSSCPQQFYETLSGCSQVKTSSLERFLQYRQNTIKLLTSSFMSGSGCLHLTIVMSSHKSHNHTVY